MQAVLAAQRAAFADELPVAIAARKDRLRRAIAMIREAAEPLVAAMSEDFGHRSREQSLFTDIGGSIAPLTHALKSVDGWARRERRRVQFPLGLLGAKAWIEWQPKGVVGIISPWNFPVNLVMGPLAGVFAAGNRAMVKTSEHTPATGAVLAEAAARHFDATELSFASGGPEVGRAFASLPFDHLIFTGATAVGRDILRAAADNLVPVTLELGGKSPAIVGRDADLSRAADRIVTGKMMNAGQICLAPDYLLVPEDRERAAIDALAAAARAQYPGAPDNPDYSAIINDRHFARLTEWIDDARAKGAEIVSVDAGGKAGDRGNARKLPLTIIAGATDAMTVMREEIFGPVLPIRRYRGIDDAIAQVNARGRPLGLYYFGPDAAERRRVLDRTISGGVTLDDVLFHVSQEDLPFGGIGPSGMGAYHGIEGFRTFSHARAVYRQARIDVAKLSGLKPPYGRATAATIRRMIGR